MAAHFEQIRARRIERMFYFDGHDSSFSIDRSIRCKFHRKPGLWDTRESNPWSNHSETPKNWAGLANLIFNIRAYIIALFVYLREPIRGEGGHEKQLIPSRTFNWILPMKRENCLSRERKFGLDSQQSPVELMIILGSYYYLKKRASQRFKHLCGEKI